MATEKQIKALLASGEVGNTFVAADAEAQPFSRAMAISLIDSQRDCTVCGNGMIVLPWGEYVAPADRISLLATTPDADRGLTVHRNCLYEISAGAKIAAAISTADKPCTYDICGRESVAVVTTVSDKKGQAPTPICQKHLDGSRPDDGFITQIVLHGAPA